MKRANNGIPKGLYVPLVGSRADSPCGVRGRAPKDIEAIKKEDSAGKDG